MPSSEAVEAALVAWYDAPAEGFGSGYRDHMRDALAAALPIIRREIAEELGARANDWLEGQPATLVNAEIKYQQASSNGFIDGITLAEHIIQGKALTGTVTAHALAEQIALGAAARVAAGGGS
jgi:hypothetical protein